MVGTFTKVEYYPERPLVRLTRVEDRLNEDSVKSVLSSTEPPAGELVYALSRLEEWMVEVTRVTDAWFASGDARVVSVAIGTGEEAALTVIAHRWIEGHAKPVVLATPPIAQSATEGDLEVPSWARDAVKQVEAAAAAFWNGRRAQMSLDDEAEAAQGTLAGVRDALEKAVPEGTTMTLSSPGSEPLTIGRDEDGNLVRS
jgi:hypothetical protein